MVARPDIAPILARGESSSTKDHQRGISLRIDASTRSMLGAAPLEPSGFGFNLRSFISPISDSYHHLVVPLLFSQSQGKV